MAAPIRSWIISRAPRILSQFGVVQQFKTPNPTCLASMALSRQMGGLGMGKRLLLWSVRALINRDPLQKKLFFRSMNGDITNQYTITNTRILPDKVQKFSTSAAQRQEGEGPGPGDSSKGPKKPLKLMDFKELIWPHPLKTLRNLWFSILIRGYFDSTYSPENFLKGAQQAVCTVSELISEGRFDDLDQLVSRDAIREVRKNYRDLTPAQRVFIRVDPRDLFFRFIYEIGMIFDDSSNKRFVEITAVFQGIHGLSNLEQTSAQDYTEHMKNSQDKVYVCNYRFIREFTKGVEDNWTINKLNHFSPKELVANTGIFQR